MAVRRVVEAIPPGRIRTDETLLFRAGVLIASGQTPRLTAPDRFHALGCGAARQHCKTKFGCGEPGTLHVDFPQDDSERCNAEHTLLQEIAERLYTTPEKLRALRVDDHGEVRRA